MLAAILNEVFWWTGAVCWGCFLLFAVAMVRVWWLERRDDRIMRERWFGEPITLIAENGATHLKNRKIAQRLDWVSGASARGEHPK